MVTVWLCAGDSIAAAPFVATVLPAGVAPPQIDGLLDDDAWRDAPAMVDFVQAAPSAGDPPSAGTELRLVHDGRTLFVALRAAAAGGPVQARTLRRDAGDIGADDHVTLVLDPQGAGRNGFIFRINALGARRDGLIFDGDQVGWSWDTRWQAQTQTQADGGWTAELAIPLALLAVPKGEAPWRFNVERFTAATGERVRLAGAVAERGVESLPDAASLAGMAAERSGLGLRLNPALRWRRTVAADGRSEQKFSPSADAFWQARPGVTVSAALNTDFADADPDDREVNLTRFELYRPDRRAFFTQDSGRFAFGGLEGDDPDLLAFYSRRIGLGRVLDAGLKAAGSLGDVDFGMLAAQVERSPDATASSPPRMMVARAALPLGQTQRLGVIGTAGHPDGVSGSSLVGIDHHWRRDDLPGDRTVESTLWLMQSRNADAGTGRAVGFQIDAPNLGWNGNLQGRRIDDNFEPALGYIEESGIERVDLDAGWWHRDAEGSDWRPRVYAGHRRRLDGSEHSRYVGPALEWGSAAGDFGFVEAYDESERIAEAFEVLPGLTVPAGRHRWIYGAVNVGTSAARVWSGELFLRGGGWYDGRLAEQTLSLRWRPDAHWSFVAGGTRQSARIGGARFVVRAPSLTVEHAGSTRSAQSLVVQRDNVSGQTAVSARARWDVGASSELRLAFDRLQPARAAPELRESFSVVWATEWAL